MDGFSQAVINGLTPSLSSKAISGVASAYLPAFIEVVDANQLGWNTNRTVPFFLNRDSLDYLLEGLFDDAKDLPDSPAFWSHTLTIGFQPEFSGDADPNQETAVMGVTPENPLQANASLGYSVIYLEAIVDHAIEYYGKGQETYPGALQQLFYSWFLGTCAHETGHSPGKKGETSDHNEDGLMKKGGDKIGGIYSFTPGSILRFRNASSWSGRTP